MVETLQNLQHIYSKWERQGNPYSSSSSSSSSSNGAAGPKCTQFSVNDNYSKIVDSGRQAWKQKYGNNLGPRPQRRLRRVKNGPTTTTSASSSVGGFKINPTIYPENRVTRPFMGRCCHCLPHSRNALYDESMASADLCDVLKMGAKTEDNILVRSVALLRGDNNHSYPDLSLQVLVSPRVREAIQKSAVEQPDGPDVKSREFQRELKRQDKRARVIMKKMRAQISNVLVKFTGWFLVKVLSRWLTAVQVHTGQMDMVRKACQKEIPVIFLPSHRSHLDYILVTFILHHHGIKAPHVAAGDNLYIPIFRNLMKGLGGFFIRRKMDRTDGKKDHVYRAVLHSYMEELLRAGQHLEFFLEGGRTRSGKACVPKGGLLSVVVDTFIEGGMEDAYLVPISINYEKLLDGNFSSEQMGNPKVSETLWIALKGIYRVFMSNFGSVRVDFGQPFSLKEYVQGSQVQRSISQNSPDTIRRSVSANSLYGTDIVLDEQRQLIKGLADHVVHHSVQMTAIMSTQLVAFLLLTKYRQGASVSTIIPSFDWLKEEIAMRDRDLGFSGTSSEVIHYACALLGRELVSCHIAQRQPQAECDNNRNADDGDDEEFVITPVISLPNLFELQYYANSVISVFLLESIIATALQSVLDVDPAAVQEGGAESPVISRQMVLDTASQICDILQYEFIFVPPCTSLEVALAGALDKFMANEVLVEVQREDNFTSSAERDWANRLTSSLSWEVEEEDEEDLPIPDQKLKIQGDSYSIEKLNFLQSILGPFVESYWIVACHLTRLLDGDLPEDEFFKVALRIAKERVEKGIAQYNESVSASSLKNAIRALYELKVTEVYYKGDTKMISLYEDYNDAEVLGDFIALLESYKR